jgi:hypothetical protein
MEKVFAFIDNNKEKYLNFLYNICSYEAQIL